MKKIIVILILGTSLMFNNSCSVMKQAKTLSNCSYSIANVSNFQVAGVSLDKVNNLEQLNVLDMMKVVSAITNKSAEIAVDVHVKVKNTENKSANINKLQWIVEYEGKELLRGSHNDLITIAPNSTTEVILPVTCDAAKLLEGKSVNDLYAIYKNITGNNGKKTALKIKVKPTINKFTVPSYIKIDATL